MKLPKIVNYELDFKSVWAQSSAALMGAFLFLRVVYYLGLKGLADCTGAQLWLELILPLVIGAGYIALLRGVELNRPVVYGVLGVLLCVLMIVWNFRSVGTLRAVVSLVWYLLAAAVLVGTVMGVISNRLLLLVSFAVPAVFRFFAEDVIGLMKSLSLAQLMPVISTICALVSLACLAPALTGKRPEKT